MNWQDKFKEEFGIHFKDSAGELQFAITFIEELLGESTKAENWFETLKDNPSEIISWCEAEIREYKRLIKIIKRAIKKD